MRTIAFFNNKGGVGKTTLVYHLSWMLTRLGHKALAVDLDPQANLTSMFLPEKTLEEIWSEEAASTFIIMGALSPIIRGMNPFPCSLANLPYLNLKENCRSHGASALMGKNRRSAPSARFSASFKLPALCRERMWR